MVDAFVHDFVGASSQLGVEPLESTFWRYLGNFLLFFIFFFLLLFFVFIDVVHFRLDQFALRLVLFVLLIRKTPPELVVGIFIGLVIDLVEVGGNQRVVIGLELFGKAAAWASRALSLECLVGLIIINVGGSLIVFLLNHLDEMLLL